MVSGPTRDGVAELPPDSLWFGVKFHTYLPVCALKDFSAAKDGPTGTQTQTRVVGAHTQRLEGTHISPQGGDIELISLDFSCCFMLQRLMLQLVGVLRYDSQVTQSRSVNSISYNLKRLCHVCILVSALNPMFHTWTYERTL